MTLPFIDFYRGVCPQTRQSKPPLDSRFLLQICQLSCQGGSIELQQLQENVSLMCRIDLSLQHLFRKRQRYDIT